MLCCVNAYEGVKSCVVIPVDKESRAPEAPSTNDHCITTWVQRAQVTYPTEATLPIYTQSASVHATFIYVRTTQPVQGQTTNARSSKAPHFPLPLDPEAPAAPWLPLTAARVCATAVAIACAWGAGALHVPSRRPDLRHALGKQRTEEALGSAWKLSTSPAAHWWQWTVCWPAQCPLHRQEACRWLYSFAETLCMHVDRHLILAKAYLWS